MMVAWIGSCVVMFTSICIALPGVELIGIDFSGHFPVLGVGSWLSGVGFSSMMMKLKLS